MSAARVVGALSTFIANQPKGAALLQLKYKGVAGSTAETLISFDCATEPPAAVAQAAAEHCYGQAAAWAEAQGGDCLFQLVYYDTRGGVLGSTPFRVGGLEGEQRSWNGSPESIIQQMQSHQHATTALMLQSIGTVTNSYKHIIETQAGRIRELEVQLNAALGKVEAQKTDDSELALAALETERFQTLVGAGEKLLKALSDGRPKQQETAGKA